MKKKWFASFLLLLMIFHQCSAMTAFAEIIEDDVAKELLKNQDLKKPDYKPEIIEDEVADKEFKGKSPLKPPLKKETITDTLLEGNIEIQKALRPKPITKPIRETDEILNVYIHTSKKINSSYVKREGEKVYFKISHDVYKKGKLFIKKDSEVEAVLENISKPAMGGDPEELEIGSFSTKDINGNIINLTGEVKKQGANRATWVKPIVYVGYSASIYGAPLLLFVFIKGGKAQITPKDDYKLYYEE